ncbi:uncharacterized protein VDAG_08842 [Verticillium dahliae VdLs.17]|uniref:Zinc finger PHD-type domain-containing protein n=1 Tax=Verticillium dahliae (strain VdLs.17 / ATCC MYA-4575 / FGSC 10137) TaxID=498257 RepID=G2XFB0_VERDV|nr:uncharacterized protein VDAG_08842 [Verticillium dahliae VdLs.17]EGY18508.1 hypothetical protein VDAG_08842 [Verticillium dahliae VdLs.17]
MVSGSKRAIHEVSGDVVADDDVPLLHRIRNMWQFANLCQWIYLFGKVVKLDDRLDTEEIEAECLKPNSLVLQEIGLALLKNVSSHRGLTHEIFDEYTRRQYMAKAPEKNPFGAQETPAKFAEFDALTKIRVLQQLTQWVMRHPDRLRDKMGEPKDVEQTNWRIEPIGWDADDRTYYVLDDNRVYRMTDAPPPTPPKKRTKAARQGRRASKRRRTNTSVEAEDTDDPIEPPKRVSEGLGRQDEDFGGMLWECVAITLDDVRGLIASFAKTRDENEKVLKSQLEEHLLPILEKQEESRKRKALQRERELINLSKMVNAKRSSRLANKHEQQLAEEQAREEEQRRAVEEAAARKAELKQMKLEAERNRRLASRENRLKDREARRLKHEDELSNLSEDSRSASQGPGRLSDRQRHAEILRTKQALQKLDDEDEGDDWIFDCVCGVYGQVDDGTHSIACEQCNVWQHSKCVGVREDEAEESDFHFICSSCRRAKDDDPQARTIIRLKINRPHTDAPLDAAPDFEQPSSGAAEKTKPAVDLFDSKAKLGAGAVTDKDLDESKTPSDLEAPVHVEPKPVPVTPGMTRSDGHPATSFPPLSHASVNETPRLRGSTSPVRPADGLSSPISRSILATPILSQEGKRVEAAHASTLPSTESGFSPTKQSPAPLPRPRSASSKTSSVPAVFPPTMTLAPSPQQPILTPPEKQAEPARPQPSDIFRAS